MNFIVLLINGERYILIFDEQSLACARQSVRNWLNDPDLDFNESQAELLLNLIDEFDPAVLDR